MNTPRDDRPYNRYLDAAISAGPEDPDAFFARHPDLDREQRELIRDLHDSLSCAPAAAEGDLPFGRLGDYRLLAALGSGGMGSVYLAEQESLGRRVALKVTRPELAASPAAAERFEREARAIAKLRHPSVVTIHDVGAADGVRYIAMEYLEGRSLAQELRERTPSPRAALAWCAALARALEHAHERGIVHRDVKPSNVHIGDDGCARLLDFGLARQLDGAVATLTDQFAGSPGYAAPEQIEGAPVDERTDVYSLGVTLYECLTGRAPFEGKSVEEVFHKVLESDPAPPRRLDPTIPRDVQVVVLQAMARDPARRYANAGAFAADLEAILELRPIQARPPGRVERARRAIQRRPALATALVSALLGLLALGAFATLQQRRADDARRSDAARSVAAARERIDDYRESRAEFRDTRTRVASLQQQLVHRYVTPDEYRFLDEEEARMQELERGWETLFYEVLDLLSYAERVDPAVDGTAAVRAELYFERRQVALEDIDFDTAEVYAELAREADPGGAIAQRLERSMEITLETVPAGATVYVLRFERLSELDPEGAPRLVPVPLDAPPPFPPGSWVLEVVADAQPARRGDLIRELAGHPIEGSILVSTTERGSLRVGARLVAVDGVAIEDTWDAAQHAGPHDAPRGFTFEQDGARVELEASDLAELGVRIDTPLRLLADPDRAPLRAVVWRAGRELELELPAGVDARPNAAPAPLFAATRIGDSPASIELELGRYLAVVRKEGHEDVAVYLGNTPGPQSTTLELFPRGTTPPGFVRLHSRVTGADLMVQEREVTCADYLEYVNDPFTQAGIDSAPRPMRYPRAGAGASVQPYWPRRPDGRFELPDGWRPDWPVIGVSWDDAVAYAEWYERRCGREDLDFRLPTRAEFAHFASGDPLRPYPWGAHFRPRWARLCFAKPTASPGPILEYPIDRSMFGIHDVAGGAMEWLDDWFDESAGRRALGGGAWGQGASEVPHVGGGFGLLPEQTTGETGLRLVATRRAPR